MPIEATFPTSEPTALHWCGLLILRFLKGSGNRIHQCEWLGAEMLLDVWPNGHVLLRHEFFQVISMPSHVPISFPELEQVLAHI